MLESMAQGVVPVVTRASSGIKNIIFDGENGYTAPVGDMISMAGIIARLARDPDMMRRLGKQAYEASKHYSMDNYVIKFSIMLDDTMQMPVKRWREKAEMPREVAQYIRRVPKGTGLENMQTTPPPAMDSPARLMSRVAANAKRTLRNWF